MLILIDNYDSFTYNIVQYLLELGEKVEVYRNDAICLKDIFKKKPKAIIISPGPGKPQNAGISCKLANEAKKTSTPLLGICLGFLCIGKVFGGEVIHAPELMHGKTSNIHHNKEGVFKGIPSPFEATRYHSLILSQNHLAKDELSITASTFKNNIIMGISHHTLPIFGVQFHPESILTAYGYKILSNFINIASY